MTELEKEEAKLRGIVNELHEAMKHEREAAKNETPEDEMDAIRKKSSELWEARAKQRRIVYKLRKEAENERERNKNDK